MLLMRAELLHPQALISVRGLPGMRGIALGEGHIRIGAAMTHAEIAASPDLKKLMPSVSETFDHVATRRIRNVATVGGNLAHANPHQDPPVTLTAFDATVIVRGPKGERRIRLGDLFVDFFQTSMAPDEILTAVEIPVPVQGAGTAFLKYLPRSADDYATVNVAVVLTREGSRVEKARIAIGSMGSTVICSAEAESMIAGRIPDQARLDEVSKAALRTADPELDSRGSPEYKRRIAPIIVRRAIEAAWKSAAIG
jgi:carbon-monoxide dehydrogenase medium subunit